MIARFPGARWLELARLRLARNGIGAENFLKGARLEALLARVQDNRRPINIAATLHTKGTSMTHELKVLVADDEKAYCEAMRDVLEEAGAHVYLAYNATSAETLFRVMAPDLAIVDLMMPGMNGLDLIRKLRAMVGQEHVPIIAASGLALQVDREEALRAGASAHLAKPFTAKELRDAVRRLIPLAQTGALTPGT